jgi:IS5 family transposase
MAAVTGTRGGPRTSAMLDRLNATVDWDDLAGLPGSAAIDASGGAWISHQMGHRRVRYRGLRRNEQDLRRIALAGNLTASTAER